METKSKNNDSINLNVVSMVLAIVFFMITIIFARTYPLLCNISIGGTVFFVVLCILTYKRN
jgi:Ca2+/Na+ antiporter